MGIFTGYKSSPAACVGDMKRLIDNFVPRGRQRAACPGDPERTCIMLRNLLRLGAMAAVFAATVSLALPGQAAMINLLDNSVPLSDLIGNDTAVVGDKEFSNFAYTPTGNAPAAEDVTVKGFYDGILQAWGLQFSGNFSVGFLEPKILDAGLSFEIEALDPNYLISGVHLNGTAQVDGTGSAGITEVISGAPLLTTLDPLRILTQKLNGVNGPNNATGDWVYFSDELGVTGYRKIRVTKDIRLRAGPGDFDSAELTTFQQVFTQERVDVPEPGTALLASIAVVGIAGIPRRL